MTALPPNPTPGLQVPAPDEMDLASNPDMGFDLDIDLRILDEDCQMDETQSDAEANAPDNTVGQSNDDIMVDEEEQPANTVDDDGAMLDDVTVQDEHLTDASHDGGAWFNFEDTALVGQEQQADIDEINYPEDEALAEAQQQVSTNDTTSTEEPIQSSALVENESATLQHSRQTPDASRAVASALAAGQTSSNSPSQDQSTMGNQQPVVEPDPGHAQDEQHLAAVTDGEPGDVGPDQADVDQPAGGGHSANYDDAAVEQALEHSIIVNYNGQEVSLFPSDQPSYLVADQNLVDSSMQELLRECRASLGDDITGEQEVAMEFPDFGLFINEDCVQAPNILFKSILIVHARLHRNDDAESRTPLYINLSKETRVSSRLGRLFQAVSEGLAYSQLDFVQAQTRDEPNEDGQASDAPDQTGDEVAEAGHDDGSRQAEEHSDRQEQAEQQSESNEHHEQNGQHGETAQQPDEHDGHIAEYGDYDEQAGQDGEFDGQVEHPGGFDANAEACGDFSEQAELLENGGDEYGEGDDQGGDYGGEEDQPGHGGDKDTNPEAPSLPVEDNTRTGQEETANGHNSSLLQLPPEEVINYESDVEVDQTSAVQNQIPTQSSTPTLQGDQLDSSADTSNELTENDENDVLKTAPTDFTEDNLDLDFLDETATIAAVDKVTSAVSSDPPAVAGQRDSSPSHGVAPTEPPKTLKDDEDWISWSDDEEDEPKSAVEDPQSAVEAPEPAAETPGLAVKRSFEEFDEGAGAARPRLDSDPKRTKVE